MLLYQLSLHSMVLTQQQSVLKRASLWLLCHGPVTDCKAMQLPNFECWRHLTPNYAEHMLCGHPGACPDRLACCESLLLLLKAPLADIPASWLSPCHASLGKLVFLSQLALRWRCRHSCTDSVTH